MPRGRIPKPKVVNDLKGDPGKRRRYSVEPEPPKDHPECPAHLGEIAKEEWEYTCRQLSDMGLLSRADKTSLEMYCSAYERYRKAEQHIAEHGDITTTPSGYEQQSAHAGMMNKLVAKSQRLSPCHLLLADIYMIENGVGGLASFTTAGQA